jgi:hypothetical protein
VAKLTVTLPEGVLERLKTLAAERGISVNRYVGEVLKDVVAKSGTSWAEAHEALHKEIGSRRRLGEWNREETYAERLRK